MDIKFRVYSLRKKRMFYPTEFRVKLNRDGAKHVLLCDPEEPDTHYEKLKSYKLLVTSTLRDKNGLEIYQGDILQYAFGKVVVEWRHGGLYGVINGNELIVLTDKHPDLREIVGNIYETVDKRLNT